MSLTATPIQMKHGKISIDNRRPAGFLVALVLRCTVRGPVAFHYITDNCSGKGDGSVTKRDLGAGDGPADLVNGIVAGIAYSALYLISTVGQLQDTVVSTPIGLVFEPAPIAGNIIQRNHLSGIHSDLPNIHGRLARFLLAAGSQNEYKHRHPQVLEYYPVIHHLSYTPRLKVRKISDPGSIFKHDVADSPIKLELSDPVSMRRCCEFRRVNTN